MKRILLATLAVLLVLVGVFSPFSAGNVSAAANCGDLYTVQKGDYLTKIAQFCGVTYDSLLKANPEIKNPNLIYTGQVIRIKAGVVLPNTTNYVVVKGDTLSSIAVRFGTTVAKIRELNPTIKDSNVIYVGQVLKLPVTGSGNIPTTGAQVSLSSTSARPGATIEVSVKGFPANANIDFRMGKDGQAYSVVVDSKTDASGVAKVRLTIPDIARAGEKWAVRVMTTDRKGGVEVKSALITIG